MEEEVSLRELIEVLLKRKLLVAVTTIIALITSGILSFVILPPVYEAKATLQISLLSSNNPPQGNSPLEALLQSLAASQQVSMETYLYQITNPMLLQRVQEKLGLDREKYSIPALQKAIKVQNPKGTNLLEITISDTDPGQASKLVNTLADEFVAFIKDLRAGRLGQSTAALEEQLKQEEEKLNAVTEEYRQFLLQPNNVKELEAEQEDKIRQLTTFKSDLLTTRVELRSTREALKAAEAKLDGIPPTLKTTKAVADEPLLQDLAREQSGRPAQEVAGLTLESEEPNPVYLALATEINKYHMEVARLEEKLAALQQAIIITEEELQAIQGELAQKKVIDARYQARLQNLQENYQALLARSEDARIAGTLDTSTQIRVIAPAVEPVVPVKPRKMLNMAIAGVLGLMAGVFLAFFIEFWTRTAPQSQAGVNLKVPAGTAH
ncbi:GumC family protein [Moorella sulfitireducens]|uniref:GumC family protein n=1 Tax=Neomoorella sulfitireducens TaxID=2972948 RepID=UPI0021ACC3F5